MKLRENRLKTRIVFKDACFDIASNLDTLFNVATHLYQHAAFEVYLRKIVPKKDIIIWSQNGFQRDLL